MEQVEAARKNNIMLSTIPERTDMTHDEVVALIEDEATEAVIQATNAELAAEMSAMPNVGYGEIVDYINQELDEQQ